jgi:glycosyltransferase involved in cell wall biosynthesis
MKFSVFTPTHNTKWLFTPYRSLRNQTFKDFEWVIGVNGHAEIKDIPEEILANDWVKVHVLPKSDLSSNLIGYLKNWICYKCSGIYLVELDHDDELTENCLEVLNKYITKNKNPEFLHSDCISINIDTGESLTFSADNGWQQPPSEYKFNEKIYQYQPVWDVTAASICQIYYAPNHVRVWKKSFYKKIGGHNKLLNISDDHELCVRTFIADTKMIKIPEVLYVYHLHSDGANTHQLISSKDQSYINFDTYIDDIGEAFCRRKKLMSLHMTGIFMDDYGSTDISDLSKVESNSHGFIKVKNTLAYTKICKDISCKHPTIDCHHGFLNELYRILVPQGILILDTDRNHKLPSFWSANRLDAHTIKHQNFMPDNITPWINERTLDPRLKYNPDEIYTIRQVLQPLKVSEQPGYNDFWPDFPNDVKEENETDT